LISSWDVPWVAGACVAVTGPSGAGKSTLLRLAASLARRAQQRVVTINVDPCREGWIAERPLVDLFGGTVERAMRSLSRAGLWEGGCFVRRPSELSAGQLFRLRLALAMERLAGGRGPRFLMIDEFGSALDSVTALGVSALLRRFGERVPGVRVIVATPRGELAAALGAARIVAVGAGHRVMVSAARRRGRGGSGLGRVVIGRGTVAEYRSLAALHYRSGRPATIARVMTARLAGEVAGVLVVSMPTLNGSWRRRAWPERFALADKRELARRLNDPVEGVRCLSRVIVDPRFRGVGVATALVRAYLSRPMTARTEAVAALGGSGFFERAGMVRQAIGVSAGDARLLDLFEQSGLERWELSSPGRAYARARRLIGARLLSRELARWGRSSRAAQPPASEEAGTELLFARACRRLGVRPVAFVACSAGGREKTRGTRWRTKERAVGWGRTRCLTR
ncbi:MAG: hypothetical protein JNK58_09040, partial [Phycisphaerae bacterium]|nr:hypothetical protein [Phycisphaerae bacterium]